MIALTPTQLRVAYAFANYRDRHGVSPTIQEIADELGRSKVTIFEIVDALEAKGVLHRNKGKFRSIIIDTSKLPYRADTLIDETVQMLETIANVCGTSDTAVEARRLAEQWKARIGREAVSNA